MLNNNLKRRHFKCYSIQRLSGVENQLLIGSNSYVNAITWSSSLTSIGNVDIICFGHLLFEMSTGYELFTHAPTKHDLQLELHRFPQVFFKLDLTSLGHTNKKDVDFFL